MSGKITCASCRFCHVLRYVEDEEVKERSCCTAMVEENDSRYDEHVVFVRRDRKHCEYYKSKTENEISLRPCPFCGGEAKVEFVGSWGNGYILVKCQTCGAQAGKQYYGGERVEIPLEDTVGGKSASEIWNRRVERV